MKLSNTQQKIMDLLINADTERKNGDVFLLPDGTIKSNHSWSDTYKKSDGTFNIRGHSSTLRALEKRGLIEIVSLGGDMSDTVRLVHHENKRKPLNEEFGLNKYTFHLKRNTTRNVWATNEELAREKLRQMRWLK